MGKNSYKEYNCPYCFQTSSRKYNIDIHIQRKHRYPPINNANQTPLFKEPPPDLIDFKKSPTNWNRSIEEQQPQSSTSFYPSQYSPFYTDSFFYYDKEKDDYENKKESRRRFNKILSKYIQKIVIPSLKLQNTQFTYTGRNSSNYIFIDPSNMPKAYKIYQCHKCFMQTLKPFFGFQEIHPTNKFIYNCYSNHQQTQHHTDNEAQIKTSKLQEMLLSVIDFRLRSKNNLLKMIVFPNNFIENTLALRLLRFLMSMMRNEEDHTFRWLLELLENEGFIDLGEIGSQHWAKRAYSGDNYSVEKNVTKLEKEELKQFISIAEGTFGLIKFKIDDKTIYTFSYLPL